MSAAAVAEVWADGPGDPRYRLSLMLLADGANDDGVGRLPPASRIAERACCTADQAERMLADFAALEVLQLIELPTGEPGFRLAVGQLADIFGEHAP